MLMTLDSHMADGEAAAMVFLFAAIVLPIALGIAIVLWMIIHQREHSKKMKEEAKKYDVKIEEGDTKRHLVRSLTLIGGGWLLSQPWNIQNRIESLAIIGIILFLLGLILLGYWLVADAENSSRKKKEILAVAKSQSKGKGES